MEERNKRTVIRATLSVLFCAVFWLQNYPDRLFGNMVVLGQDSARRPATAANPPPSLTGAFIQFDNDTRWVKKQDWELILDQMYDAGMDTIIIQWLHHVDPEKYDLDFLSSSHGIDHTAVILSYAQKKKMKVFIGLWFSEDWWSKAETISDIQYFKDGGTLETENKRVAKAIWERYGKSGKYSDSFAGWYIPQETWNMPYNDSQIKLLHTFLYNVSKFCKSISGKKPVSISPIFNPVGYPAGTPSEVERVYSRLLIGAGVDLVMVQDGSGARCWDTKRDIDKYLPSYLNAFLKACKMASVENKKMRQSEVKLWADIELFVLMGGECRIQKSFDAKPACLRRIKWQIEAAAPYVEKLLAFDFNHYMNTVTADQHMYEKPLCERTRLYCSYVKWFVPENKTCRSFAEDPNCASLTDRHCLQ